MRITKKTIDRLLQATSKDCLLRQREHENRLRTPVFLITIFEGEAPFSIIYRDQGKEA
jgi:hypothetical protein